MTKISQPLLSTLHDIHDGRAFDNTLAHVALMLDLVCVRQARWFLTQRGCQVIDATSQLA